MNAINILMEEHLFIERLLLILRRACDLSEQGLPVRPEFFLQAAEFISEFADGIHGAKEEKLLFPAIAAYQQKAVDVLLGEHELARVYTSGMAKAALTWQNGDPTALKAICKNARLYADLLQEHIAHENKLIFPASNWLVPAAKQTQVDERFAAFEKNKASHLSKLSLLEALEKEMA